VQIGALVDSVREVIEIQQSEIEGPPKMGLSVDTGFIQGMTRRGDDFVLILEVDRIFSAEELKAVSRGGEQGAPLNIEESEEVMATL
jgi:purine-binding chemotaxis protein CheW